MADYSQDLIFTVLPFGQFRSSLEPGGPLKYFLDFSVIISPRLKSTSSDPATLAQYPDWCSSDPAGPNWSDTIQDLVGLMQLTVTGLGAPLALHQLSPAVDHDHVRDVFPSRTPVIPYVYEGMDGRKIRSAPVAKINDAIATLYGAFGLSSPGVFPTWATLAPATAFGPLGFEQRPGGTRDVPDPGIQGDGLDRKNRLRNKLEDILNNGGAVPDDLSMVANSFNPPIPGAERSLAFLQHQQFIQRDRPAVNAITHSPPPPAWDFHQMVAGIGSSPTLLRRLGFVVDFRTDAVPDSIAANWAAHPTALTPVLATLSFTGNLPLHLSTNPVLPSTQASIGFGVFRPAPADPSHTDHVGRMLNLSDTSKYRVIRVDHDNAAIKAMRFANTVTRSRVGGVPLTFTTPDRYALPALKTGGFAVARSNRAVTMVATLGHQTTDLQDKYFDANGNSTPPPLTEDDLTRGYRFDVLHDKDGKWRSLMFRQGPIQIGSDTLPNVLEEDCIVPAPTSASPRQPNAPKDLYLQETLTRWDGWSLAVPRVGQPLQGIGPTNDTSGSSGFSITTQWEVPGSTDQDGPEVTDGNVTRLPRLRFGDTYRLRARAVDLAGNSLPVADAPLTGPAISPAFKHLRFEPIPAPRLLLVDTPFSGASEEVVVVRSESATVDGKDVPDGIDNSATTRLVLPGRSSVFMAEQHGAFDASSVQAAMDNSAARFADLSTRDGYQLEQDPLVTLPHGGGHGTDNPYVVADGFLPINYLPEYIGRGALVRNLPVNAFKKTTAVLPFDQAGQGWPKFEAPRIVLSRGNTNWSLKPVNDPNTGKNTIELDLTLEKGVMVTTLVNCGIAQTEAQLMAMWEWIQLEAARTHTSTTTVWNAILAGEHWMFTPWRRVTFVHAVRTPLLVPVLYLVPTKTTIGQTNATFTGTQAKPAGGSVKMSRKSTARIDVDATWKMPVDTGTNADPVTPQTFTANAFRLEVPRVGVGYLPGPHNTVLTGPDALSFDQKHEFGDTKFRAVDYQATATSFYVEYFREEKLINITDTDPIAKLKSAPTVPGVAFEASTVKVTLSWAGDAGPGHPAGQSRELVAAPPGTPLDAPAPVPGDFVVTEDPTLASDPAHATNGSFQLLQNANIDLPGVNVVVVRFSYVGPTIHTYSNPVADKTTSASMLVLNSQRPKAPKIRYVVPIYQRTANATSITRTGGALRVYLERPWWSSGDNEQLGVVCWHKGSAILAVLPPLTLQPYVTSWGYDPVFKSATVPGQPTPACFPLAVAKSTSGVLTLDETTSKVDVAGHKVGYDGERQLWYCDIQVTGTDGKELASYSPFIRFAFARYQPNSITGAHLSKVEMVDFASLAPNRHVTMTGTGSSRTVVVTGRAPVASAQSNQPSQLFAIIEQKDTRFLDDTLGWSRAVDLVNGAGPPIPAVHELSASHSSGSDLVTWRGTIPLPNTGGKPIRLTIEEHERIAGGAGDGRIVYTDSLPITTPPPN